jgi:hypothetical protein
VRSPFGVRDAIAIMTHGENTRVIDESEFHQNIQGPKRLAYDGIARRAISDYRGPGNIFEQALRAERLFVELFRGLLIQ